MRKIILASALVSVIVLGGVRNVTAAEDVSKKDSEGTIKFKPKDTIPPIDPEGPEEPIGPGLPGNFMLTQVSNWNFGQQEITTSTADYKVLHAETIVLDGEGKPTGDTYTTSPFLQTDDYSGSGQGWSLSVAQKGQFSGAATETTETLTGAELSFLSAATFAAKKGTDPVIQAPAWGTTTKLIPGDGTVGESVTISNAQPNAGLGTWMMYFNTVPKTGTEDKNTVNLEVPVAAYPKVTVDYKTELNWVLSNKPTEPEVPDPEPEPDPEA